MATSITSSDVAQAAAKLAGMRRSLGAWLKFRSLNDDVVAGTAKTTKPIPYGKRVIAASRDMGLEQDIATQLYSLLSVVMPETQLPDPNTTTNPNAAPMLAALALAGSSASVSGPQAQGAFPGAAHPWLWPALIVGALLLAVTTAIKSAADVAKDSEEKACIEAGACTDYGFWLKAGGMVMLAWFAWRELGIGDVVKGAIQRRAARK